MDRALELEGLPRRRPTVELLVLSLPIIGMTVSRMLMGFIDFTMVSALGTDAQAAVSPASLFVFTVSCAGMGIANAVQTFVAQADGRGEPRRAGAYAWQSLYIAGVLGLLAIPATVAVEQWYGWIAALGHHPPAMAAMEIDYIRIALWMVIPSTLCMGLEGFFNGIRRPRVALLAVLVALGVNALGNWLLIFGNLGFPKMGIAGAALATVIGWCARAGVLAIAILRRNLDERFNTRHALAFDARRLLDLLHIGGPTAAQWLLDLGSWTVFLTLVMPPLGVKVAAASNIGLQLLHMSFMPALGIGIALCSQVGFAIGEGRPDRARERVRVGLRLTVAYMGAAGLVFLFARRPLIAVFNRDPEVIAAGVYIMTWAAIFQIFDAMQIVYMTALRGAGDTRWPAALMAVCCWGVFIGGGYAMSHWHPTWGLNGPWAMCTLYVIIAGTLLGWRWYSGHWEKIRLFKDANAGATPAKAASEVAVETAGAIPEAVAIEAPHVTDSAS